MPRISSQVWLIASHISEVIELRTAPGILARGKDAVVDAAGSSRPGP